MSHCFSLTQVADSSLLPMMRNDEIEERHEKFMDFQIGKCIFSCYQTIRLVGKRRLVVFARCLRHEVFTFFDSNIKIINDDT